MDIWPTKKDPKRAVQYQFTRDALTATEIYEASLQAPTTPDSDTPCWSHTEGFTLTGPHPCPVPVICKRTYAEVAPIIYSTCTEPRDFHAFALAHRYVHLVKKMWIRLGREDALPMWTYKLGMMTRFTGLQVFHLYLYARPLNLYSVLPYRTHEYEAYDRIRQLRLDPKHTKSTLKLLYFQRYHDSGEGSFN